MEILKILQGLGANEQSVRDDYMIKLKTFLRNLPKINANELQERKELFKRIWNCIFYCKIFLSFYFLIKFIKKIFGTLTSK